jgi:Mg2+ and Co2+ transporter CorA
MKTYMSTEMFRKNMRLLFLDGKHDVQIQNQISEYLREIKDAIANNYKLAAFEEEAFKTLIDEYRDYSYDDTEIYYDD